MTNTIKLAVEVIFTNQNGEILLGLRGANMAEAGEWALPGGHVELGETTAQAAAREMREELGLTIDVADLQIAAVTDVVQKDGKQYLHVTFKYNKPQAVVPQIMQPEHSKLQFFSLQNLPSPLFFAQEKIFETLRANLLYLA